MAYLNTREFPAPGRRLVHLSTTLHCATGKTIHLEDDGLDVDVVPVPEPTIEISGTENIARDYEDFKLGVRIFADVHILMTTGSSNGGKTTMMMMTTTTGIKIEAPKLTWELLMRLRLCPHIANFTFKR